MPIATVPVSFDLGPGKAGAVVVAVLGTKDISATEMLSTHVWKATADASGQGSLGLWSNAALANGSTYTVAIVHSSGTEIRTGGVVPNSASASLDSLFSTVPATALLIDGYPLLINGSPIVY